MPVRSRATVVTAAAAVLVALLAVPPASAATKPQSVTVTAKDFSFEMPSTVEPGETKLTLVNAGAEDHQVQLARLNAGVTRAQLQEALQSPSPDAALALVTFAGGANTVPPGGRQTVFLDLKPGRYVALCFVSGADNVPHLAKGMISFFSVKGARVDAPAPKSAGTIKALEYSFRLPKGFTGTGTYTFRDIGGEPHELTLLKLQPGFTADMLKQALASGAAAPAGPPPFTSAGGGSAVAPLKGTEQVKLALDPGDYVAVCFVPNAEGKAHAELGMVAGFTVT